MSLCKNERDCLEKGVELVLLNMTYEGRMEYYLHGVGRVVGG